MAWSGKRKGSGGGKKTSVRLTGFFKTKKRGLFVGSVDEMDDLIGRIKKAKAEDKGLVLFLWRNEDVEEGQPVFTSYIDVQRDKDEGDRPKGGYKKRKPIEDDDDESEEKEEKDDDDDEVPF